MCDSSVTQILTNRRWLSINKDKYGWNCSKDKTEYVLKKPKNCKDNFDTQNEITNHFLDELMWKAKIKVILYSDISSDPVVKT